MVKPVFRIIEQIPCHKRCQSHSSGHLCSIICSWILVLFRLCKKAYYTIFLPRYSQSRIGCTCWTHLIKHAGNSFTKLATLRIYMVSSRTHLDPRRAHDVIITPSLSQNDVATSFIGDNYVIITSCVRRVRVFFEKWKLFGAPTRRWLNISLAVINQNKWYTLFPTMIPFYGVGLWRGGNQYYVPYQY